MCDVYSQNQHIIERINAADQQVLRDVAYKRLRDFQAHKHGIDKMREEVGLVKASWILLCDGSDSRERRLHDILIGFLDDLEELATDVQNGWENVIAAAEALMNHRDAKVRPVSER